ncbi:MAG: depupylase/deamidase Dop [Candidatus Poribacteria bacterium]|nr:depupylase/deamidase Dop [Candidatus Poribacteria bacterium]
MTAPTIIGTETEFGISVKNAREQDLVAASTLVVNAYNNRNIPTILWDYAQESPLMDARGFTVEGENPTSDDANNSVINDILINGGRYYVDHAHPEYCTPECTNARDLVKYEKAGELILELSRLTAEQLLLDNQEIIIYKNNTDYKGHSYGAHENYLMSRKIPFTDIVDGLTPFLVTRQIFTGSGKVGVENGTEDTDFQISQRADFFEKEVGLSTMVERPIINTRDEPHADSKLYRRLHVIVGDSNMSEFTIYLKVGITALILRLIEKGVVGSQFALQDPVAVIKSVSRDLSCKNKIALKDDRNWTAIEIQQAYLELAHQHLSNEERTPVVIDVLEKWEFVLSSLKSDPMSMGQHLDWVIKKKLIDAYINRHGFKWTDSRVRMLDLQYHDLRPEKGLYARLLKNGHVERILSQEEVVHAIQHPPLDTRAYFRGTCLRKFPNNIHSVSWNSIVFNGPTGFDKIMMERPHFGTQAIIGELLNSCSVDELVNKIRFDD